VARAILSAGPAAGPVVVGVGGGHYAPRFTELALSREVRFGHMLPAYAMDLSDRASVTASVAMALERSGTGQVYLHRKSFKRPDAEVARRAAEDAGADVIDSSDRLGPLI